MYSIKCPDRDIFSIKMSRSGHFSLNVPFTAKMSRSGHFTLEKCPECPDRDIFSAKCPESLQLHLKNTRSATPAYILYQNFMVVARVGVTFPVHPTVHCAQPKLRPLCGYSHQLLMFMNRNGVTRI